MNDPYKVLGLTPGASDDEVKKAYRKLAKKYHPDANPGDKVAEQKMKEINAAYDAIVNKKPYGDEQNTGYSGGAGYGSSGFDPFGFGFGFNSGGYGGYNSSGSGSSSNSHLNAARNYINFGRYREALNVLNSISERTAEWYYLCAVANAGLGNRINAQQYAQTACKMDPNNAEYRSFLNRVSSGQSTYNTYSGSNGYRRRGFSTGGICLIYLIANMLCGLCCGRRYYC